MRKFVLGLTLLLFAINLNAGGKLLFDLTAQHFSKTLAKERTKDYKKDGRYNLPNTYVSSNSWYSRYGYMDGVFSVRLKTMPNKWRTTITVWGGYYHNNTIRLTTNSGNSYIISITTGEITINSKQFKIQRGSLDKEYVEIEVSSIDGIVIFRINGQQFYKTKENSTDRLEILQIDSGEDDALSRLEIFSVD